MNLTDFLELEKYEKKYKFDIYNLFNQLDIYEKNLIIEKVIFLINNTIVKKDLFSIIIMSLGNDETIYEGLKYFLNDPNPKYFEMILPIFLNNKDYLNKVQACDVLNKMNLRKPQLKWIYYLENGLKDSNELVKIYCLAGLFSFHSKNTNAIISDAYKKEKNIKVLLVMSTTLFHITKNDYWLDEAIKYLFKKNKYLPKYFLEDIIEILKDNYLTIIVLVDKFSKLKKHNITTNKILKTLTDYINKSEKDTLLILQNLLTEFINEANQGFYNKMNSNFTDKGKL